MATVKVTDLTKIYGNNTVLDHIDLEVPEGALVALLGPSGCGKTTTLRLIAGFEPADDGEIFIDGERINDVPAHKRNIGVVFQSYALFPHMTVAQNVAYGLEQRNIPKGEIQKKVEDILALVQLTEYRSRRPKQLSGGQQQRVALARALAIEPRILLLDECLSALDKKLRVEMQVELRRILTLSKATALFVTHDQEEALTLADYIVVMDRGKIMQWGPPASVYEAPKNRFVAGFLGKANFFSGKVLEATEGAVILEGEEGPVRIPTAFPKKEGTAVYSIRPEKILLSKKGDLPDSLPGTVGMVTYAGNLSTYTIDLSGRRMVAECQNLGGASGFQEGDPVWVHWEPEFCRLLEDER